MSATLKFTCSKSLTHESCNNDGVQHIHQHDVSFMYNYVQTPEYNQIILDLNKNLEKKECAIIKV